MCGTVCLTLGTLTREKGISTVLYITAKGGAAKHAHRAYILSLKNLSTLTKPATL